MRLPERTVVETESRILEDGSFELIDGVLGEFGVKLNEDGYEFIAYKVPPGDYEVTTSMNFAVVFVEDGKTFDVISENRFENGISSLNITVKENEIITLTLNARMIFTPIR